MNKKVINNLTKFARMCKIHGWLPDIAITKEDSKLGDRYMVTITSTSDTDHGYSKSLGKYVILVNSDNSVKEWIDSFHYTTHTCVEDISVTIKNNYIRLKDIKNLLTAIRAPYDYVDDVDITKLEDKIRKELNKFGKRRK